MCPSQKNIFLFKYTQFSTISVSTKPKSSLWRIKFYSKLSKLARIAYMKNLVSLIKTLTQKPLRLMEVGEGPTIPKEPVLSALLLITTVIITITSGRHCLQHSYSGEYRQARIFSSFYKVWGVSVNSHQTVAHIISDSQAWRASASWGNLNSNTQ